MSNTIEIVNCNTTNVLRKPAFLLPKLRLPFNVLMGLKYDK